MFFAMITWNQTACIWYSVIVPFLPREFKKLGIPEHLYGYIFATFSISAMLWSLVCGKLLTLYGRRIIVFIGVLAIGISVVAFGFLSYIHSYPLLITACFIIRALEGMSASTILTTCYSIVVITFKENQSKYLGFLEAASGLSMLIAPAIGSVLYTYFGFEMTFWILGGIDFIIAPFVLFIVPK